MGTLSDCGRLATVCGVEEGRMPDPTVPIASRPTIRTDGTSSDQLSDSLLALSITESVTEMARCEARFSNWGMRGGQAGFVFYENNLLALGSPLQVSFGSDNQVSSFQGRISALEGLFPRHRPPEIQLNAEDGLEAMRRTRRNRTFGDRDDLSVIEEIAAEYGLETVVAGAPLGLDQVRRTFAQLDQTDLEFLRERARHLGMDLWIESNTLHLRGRASAEPDCELSLGSSLLGFRVRADLARQVTDLAVTGWDVQTKQTLHAIADTSLTLTQGLGARTGSEIANEVYGDRPATLIRQLPLTRAEAEALADAHFLDRAYQFVIGSGEAAGNPNLRAGKTVRLAGLGPWFNGVYYLAAVRHTFEPDTGYRTTFTVERPALEGIPSSARDQIRRRHGRRSRAVKNSPAKRQQKPIRDKGGDDSVSVKNRERGFKQ